MSSSEFNTTNSSPRNTIISQINFTIKMIALTMYFLHYFAIFLSSIAVIPFFFAFVGIFQLLMYFLSLYIRWTRNCLLLRRDDAVWLQDRSSNRHVIHALMLIQGSPDIEKLRELIEERLVWAKDDSGKRICSRLTQVISTHLGIFAWEEDKNFDIKNHVTSWTGRIPKTNEELEDVLSEIVSSPLPMNGFSPWQFIVVPTSLDRNIFGFMLRMHHSMADGVALVRVFVMNLYDNPPTAPEPKMFTAKQRFYMWCKAVIVGPYIVMGKLLASRDSSLVHGQELSGKKVVSWSKDFNLSLVKQIKNETGTTVNDVMVSCIAGGLCHYLESNGVKNPDDMWASVPFNIRGPTKSPKLNNKFALVFMRLPIIAESCLERLFLTKHRMDIVKKSAEPLVNATTVKYLMMVPSFISKPLIDFFSCKMSCVLSNVPGPQEFLYIGGQKVVEGIFWPPQRANIGIGLSIFSYGGCIRVGICSDSSVLPDPCKVVKSIEKRFSALVDALNMNETNN